MSTTESKKLLKFVTGLAGDRFLRVEEEIGHGYFVLNTTEAQRRQAKHDIRSVEDIVVELVRNSRDAGAQNIYIATKKDSTGIREICVIDDGEGIPSEFHERIFEPRVTSKIDNVIEDQFGVHGRGMALYSIRSRVDEAKVVTSKPNQGSAVKVVINTHILRERKDQSTPPKIKATRDEIKILSGPHNIFRHLVELSIESPNINIFYGSDAEILATIIADSDRETDKESIPGRTATIRDQKELKRYASSQLGLKVSSRNCQRIISDEIQSLSSIRRWFGTESEKIPRISKAKSSETGRISEQDLTVFIQEISEVFRELGDKYYLSLDGEPSVNCSKTAIRIKLTIKNEDSW